MGGSVIGRSSASGHHRAIGTVLVAVLVAVLGAAARSPTTAPDYSHPSVVRAEPARLSHRAVGAPAPAQSPANQNHITATLYSAVIEGTAAPGTWVAANLTRYGDGPDQRAFGGGAADTGGRFDILLIRAANGPPMPIIPGDRLFAAFGVGPDKHNAVLPGLSAVADAATDRVVGITLPDAEIVVTLDARPDIQLATTADDAGDYRVDFTGLHDLRAGTSGTVMTELGNTDMVVLGWAIPYVNITLGEVTVVGIGPRGQAVTLSLWRGGQIVATAQGLSADAQPKGTPNWSVELRDPSGELVPVLGGDRLAVTIAERTTDIDVPRLSVDTNTAADFIVGSAPASTSVRVTVRRGDESLTHDAGAGFDGRYTVDLAGRWDLQANDEVRVAVSLPDGHTITVATRVPGLTVQLDTGRVTGVASPFAVVSAVLRSPGGAFRGSGTDAADDLGRFAVSPVDAGGKSVPPDEGDGLEIQYVGHRVAIVIPRLTVMVDPLAEAVVGEATIGGEVTVVATHVVGSQRVQRTRRQSPQQDRSYRADFRGDLDLAAGTRLMVSYRGTDGHVAWLERSLPLLHAQIGGNLVSGEVSPGAAVSISVQRGGRPVGWRTTVSQPDGSFDGFVIDATDIPVALRAGDVIDVGWSGGTEPRVPLSGRIQFPVAPITATLDTASGDLAGSAPPLATVYIHPGGISSGGPTLTAPADAAGHFGSRLAAGSGGRPLDAGLVVEAGVLSGDGHRSYVRNVVPYLEVTLGDTRVGGQAAPLAKIGLSLDRFGRPVAEASARNDTFGNFAAVLRDPAGRATIAPTTGDLLHLSEPGSRHTNLVLPPLEILIDLLRGGLRGIGPPSMPLDIRLRQRGRADAAIEAWTDGSGQWMLRATDLPAGVTVSELVQAEARVRVDNGHRVIALAVNTPTPTASPTRLPVSPTATRASPTVSPTGAATATPRPLRAAAYFPWCHRSMRGR